MYVSCFFYQQNIHELRCETKKYGYKCIYTIVDIKSYATILSLFLKNLSYYVSCRIISGNYDCIYQFRQIINNLKLKKMCLIFILC